MDSFAIIPLCSRVGLVEWVDQTTTIKSVVTAEWEK